MEIYIVHVYYTALNGKSIYREYISDGATEEEALGKVKHLLDNVLFIDKYVTETVKISTPFEIF